VNRLGTTETLTFRCYFIDHDTPIGETGVPVGYAVPDKDVLLVDERGERVEPGAIGEMVVRSRYLSPGHWRNPDLTRATFLPDPADGTLRLYRTGDLGRLGADGCLEHLGRKDFQVKIRGRRVETSGVEEALLASSTIREALVVARRRRGDESLVAYVVPATRPAPDVSTLRRFLAARLADYMVPSAYVFLDALPLLPNGKADRRALPAPGTNRPELDVPFVAPRDDVEAAIARIWSEVLEVDRVGVDDDFLDLGGDSLMGARIIARVTDRFDVTVPLRLLWEASTVARMAKFIPPGR
jgi:acyl-coenzyme A synthetase/AMP-(fatty) acid ligase/acyl carrier protein